METASTGPGSHCCYLFTSLKSREEASGGEEAYGILAVEGAGQQKFPLKVKQTKGVLLSMSTYYGQVQNNPYSTGSER